MTMSIIDKIRTIRVLDAVYESTDKGKVSDLIKEIEREIGRYSAERAECYREGYRKGVEDIDSHTKGLRSDLRFLRTRVSL